MFTVRCSCVLGLAAAMAAVGVFVPASATAAPPAAQKTVDYVRDLIDLYFQGQERDRFFDAAGVDGELTKEGFAAAAGRPNSFVRAYDRWPAAIVFDRDRDGRLDWSEAEQYRLAVRKRVLALFDKDNDGRLNGPEREAANAYLAAGMGSPTSSQPAWTTTRRGPRPAAGPGDPGPPPDAAWGKRWDRVHATYDTNKDGKLSVDERAAMHEGVRQHYRKRLLARFDKNGNGELDGAELRAVEEAQRVEAMEWRRQAELAHWDADKDGKLNAQEQAAMEKHFAEQRRQAQQRQQQWIARWDKDGDGKLSKEERAEITKDMRRRVAWQRKQMDSNGDGEITAEEIRAYRRKLFQEMRRRRQSPNGPAETDADE